MKNNKSIVNSYSCNTYFDKICYVDSIYALYLYIYINKGISDTLFIFTEGSSLASLSLTFKNYILVNRNFSVTAYQRMKFNIGFSNCYIDEIINILESYTKDIKCFVHDHLPISFLFDKYGVELLEDGLSNYQIYKKRDNIKYKIKRFIKKTIGVHRETHGNGEYVKNIYLTNVSEVPSELKSNIVNIEASDFYTYSRRSTLSLFGVKGINAKAPYLIITQPLSEDGILSEKSKIEVYKKIVSDYSPCIIKPHPRELTDYSTVFSSSNITVIKNEIPIECMLDESSHIDTIVTIYSTAALNLTKINSEIECVFFGEEYLEQYK
ncbi:putative Lipooligosaccharide sialyltransferase [Vibrio chagasii]|nr:putative Lipooligosaccharide sialyltransferase [Vibrio chagasii]CAH6942616.1 putative Lipooligosaccharide sialyltransferase [Vibrio chagasii]CAH6944913.1 putative Lipooligosaccharide sialyltransferase [Vibrio chagasii]